MGKGELNGLLYLGGNIQICSYYEPCDSRHVSDCKMEKKIKLPNRYKPWGVGKYIGGKVYLHRQYEDALPSIFLTTAKQALKQVIPQFEYNLLSFDLKTLSITFTYSADFDTCPEPSIDQQYKVDVHGNVKALKSKSEDPWIYHHKWLWVRDDYTGFDVAKSEARSADWMALPDIDYSRIGKRSFWETNVLSRLKTDSC